MDVSLDNLQFDVPVIVDYRDDLGHTQWIEAVIIDEYEYFIEVETDDEYRSIPKENILRITQSTRG